jgi:hypothetical protein
MRTRTTAHVSRTGPDNKNENLHPRSRARLMMPHDSGEEEHQHHRPQPAAGRGMRILSTRVEGAEPPVILITAKATLAAGTACLCLTVTQESGNLWRYNLSEQKNSRLAYGKIIVPGHMAALRRAAEICADGYQPGSIERGLLDAFAQDAP